MAGDWSNGKAVDIIEKEGLSYAVRHYCAGNEFKDRETMRLWEQAATSLDDLVEHLRIETGRAELEGI